MCRSHNAIVMFWNCRLHTLNETLKAALSQTDTAGIAISQHWENVPIGSTYTATVDAVPADFTTHPSTLVLTPVDLGLSIHLQMQLNVTVNELPATG